jgi:hypothetical protein
VNQAHRTPYPHQIPLLINDRGPFYRGFLLGSVVAFMIYAGLFVTIWYQPVGVFAEALPAMIQVDLDGRTTLAIARAEQINAAAVAYLENCGSALAEQAWREAGGSQERYELLSSFIAFSPTEFADYMPEEFEMVLVEQLPSHAEGRRVNVLVAGSVLEY